MTVMAVHAHRGSPDPAAGVGENTLEAFLRARRLGADGVELDVRLTADGALAVHHDPVVRGIGPVRELAADQLPASVPAPGRGPGRLRRAEVNIEIKNLPGEPGFDPDERMARRRGRAGGGRRTGGDRGGLVVLAGLPGRGPPAPDPSCPPGCWWPRGPTPPTPWPTPSGMAAGRSTPTSPWSAGPWWPRPAGPGCRWPPGR